MSKSLAKIRRRSKVVGIFPNKASYIRLITTYLIEYENEWRLGRAYVRVQSLTKQRLKLEEVA
ncbi:MAG: transposase [Clostridia bacterium]